MNQKKEKNTETKVKRKYTKKKKTDEDKINQESLEEKESETFVSDVSDIHSEDNNEKKKSKTQEEGYLSPKKKELKEYYDGIKEIALNKMEILPNKSKLFSCAMCHKEKPHSDYFRSYSWRDVGSMNEIGERHQPICKRCARKLFNFYNEQEQNLYNAFNRWCQTMDIYFSKEIFDVMVALHNSRLGTQMAQRFDYLTDYITALGRARVVGATYYDSLYVQSSDILKIDVDDDDLFDDPNKEKIYPVEIEDWDQDDLDNYDYVIEVYHYDPFKDEDLDDRKTLYYNLAGLSSEDIMDDFAKANAAIDTCRSMLRLEKLNKLRVSLEKQSDPDIDAIKQLVMLQKAERQNISQNGKEHGFNKRFAMEQGAGSSTFTGIIKQMDNKMFEDSLVNAYDIKTSEAMESAARASWKAIFEQLNISESEFSQIVKDQRETIMDLRQELDETKEKLRLANIEIKRKELEEQLKAEIKEGES